MFTEERAHWLLTHYAWLDSQFPGYSRELDLVTTEPAHFPIKWRGTWQNVEEAFSIVKRKIQLEDVRLHLERKTVADREPHHYGEWKTSDVAGLFERGPDGPPIIHISEDLIADPVSTIAVIAHELSHYHLDNVGEPPPAGWGDLEPLTDLCACFFGFGVFLSNASFNFGGYTNSTHQGWASRRLGYLNEFELGFATAIFTVRNRIDVNLPARFLKLNPRQVYVDAIDYIVDYDANFER